MRVFVYMCGRVGAWVIISVGMHACVCVYVCMHVGAWVIISVRMHACVCEYVYVCMHVCV